MFAAADVPGASDLATLAGVLAVVTLGAIVPVVPTGAAVSGAAAYTWHHQPLVVVLTVAAGAAGAYLGDLVVFGICRLGGRRLARRMRWLRDEHHLQSVQERLQRSQIPVLLVSRLLPGGRIPVLLAAAFVEIDWRTFVIANLPACALWAVVYAAIGIVGAASSPNRGRACWPRSPWSC